MIMLANFVCLNCHFIIYTFIRHEDRIGLQQR